MYEEQKPWYKNSLFISNAILESKIEKIFSKKQFCKKNISSAKIRIFYIFCGNYFSFTKFFLGEVFLFFYSKMILSRKTVCVPWFLFLEHYKPTNRKVKSSNLFYSIYNFDTFFHFQSCFFSFYSILFQSKLLDFTLFLFLKILI